VKPLDVLLSYYVNRLGIWPTQARPKRVELGAVHTVTIPLGMGNRPIVCLVAVDAQYHTSSGFPYPGGFSELTRCSGKKRVLREDSLDDEQVEHTLLQNFSSARRRSEAGDVDAQCVP
jgi:hypothetical protein